MIDYDKIRDMSNEEILRILEYFYAGGISVNGGECSSFIEAVENSSIRKK